MTILTKDELQAIWARCEAATPGPWRVVFDTKTPEGVRALCADKPMFVPFSGTNRDNNSEFCAHARTDIPALLNHIEAQHDALAKSEEDKAVLVEALEVASRALSHCDSMLSFIHYRGDTSVAENAMREAIKGNKVATTALARVKGAQDAI